MVAHAWWPRIKDPFGNSPPQKIQLLRSLQANLASYVAEEMERVDVSNPEQGCYMDILTQAIMQKVEVEELLLQSDHDQEVAKSQEIEEEVLVTKTISSKEVWEDFENWVPSITAEYDQLVKPKRQLSKSPSKAFENVQKLKAR